MTRRGQAAARASPSLWPLATCPGIFWNLVEPFLTAPQGLRRPGWAGSGWTGGAAASGHRAVGLLARPVPGTWAGRGGARAARRRCCSRPPRCAPGTCSGRCRPAGGGRGCQAAAGPTPPASTRRPPPLPRTHRPVEVAPAAHGHKEAGVHSLQGHDPHSDGADLNDACGEGLGQGPGRHLRPRAPACMPSLTHSRSISCVPGLVPGVGTHRGPHGPCQELPRGLEDISWGVLAFSGGHWGATARCGVGEGPGQVRGNKTEPEQAGAYPGELLISVRASKEEQ